MCVDSSSQLSDAGESGVERQRQISNIEYRAITNETDQVRRPRRIEHATKADYATHIVVEAALVVARLSDGNDIVARQVADMIPTRSR
jgi:hypothetical protein